MNALAVFISGLVYAEAFVRTTSGLGAIVLTRSAAQLIVAVAQTPKIDLGWRAWRDSREMIAYSTVSTLVPELLARQWRVFSFGFATLARSLSLAESTLEVAYVSRRVTCGIVSAALLCVVVVLAARDDVETPSALGFVLIAGAAHCGHRLGFVNRELNRRLSHERYANAMLATYIVSAVVSGALSTLLSRTAGFSGDVALGAFFVSALVQHTGIYHVLAEDDARILLPSILAARKVVTYFIAAPSVVRAVYAASAAACLGTMIVTQTRPSRRKNA